MIPGVQQYGFPGAGIEIPGLFETVVIFPPVMSRAIVGNSNSARVTASPLQAYPRAVVSIKTAH